MIKKPFFDQPIKNKQEVYKKPAEMSRNDDYTIGSLLDYLCHHKYYKPIGTDLSWKTNTGIHQQVNFVEQLEEDDGAAMFFLPLKNNKKLF